MKNETMKSDLVDVIRQFDRNGYLTLEGDETVEQLSETVLGLFDGETEGIPAIVRELRLERE